MDSLLEMIIHSMTNFTLNNIDNLVILLESKDDLANFGYFGTIGTFLELANRIQNIICRLR